ncbi:ATP-binding protein [Chitinophaga silvatica]|uniref:ATP-binding protein n=1 Tax=Chitinophaga silvatica TaxID=2282649 RepID=A0A3E1Y4C6_9BACT|nr:ATP-binding protein [Chitinophaga silvatica]RFS19337.1 ATP-binding protein [Chitinophaga silvatica]
MEMQESNWEYYFQILSDLIRKRITNTLAQERNTTPILILSPLDKATGPLARFVKKYELSLTDHYWLLIALCPHIRPGFFDEVIQDALGQPADFPPIGGMRGRQFRGFLPTAETALFLLTGENWMERHLLFHRTFHPDHFFAERRVLILENPPDGEPMISGKLILNQSFVTYFTTGREHLPLYSSQFPARELKTKLSWKDVVLNPQTDHQLSELRAWYQHNKTLSGKFGMGSRINPGYRALFYGPPGTGKTVSTAILGKEFKKTVFRIDLSNLVSKYIGETEKNLNTLFEEAHHRNWILFFDEADALFGKRTQVKDAHDRYANQEVSYLMQRIETFDGLIILASNLKGNMDDAFVRRFQSVIHFPYPTPEEQLRIWQKAFPSKLPPGPGIDLQFIAQRYKLSGANIVNIAHYCCLTAMAQNEQHVNAPLLEKGILRELSKEGKAY